MYPWTSTRYDDKTFKDHLGDLGMAVLVIVGIILACFVLATFLDQPRYAYAYVQTTGDRGEKFRWTEKTATLNLRLGCPDDAPCWDAVAREAAEEWNDAGSQLRFSFLDAPRRVGLSCTRPDNYNTVIWAARDCGMDIDRYTMAFATQWTNPDGSFIDSDVVFNTAFEWAVYGGPSQHWAGKGAVDFRRVALHEFGHVLGLDHPDEHGQHVRAIMNSGQSLAYEEETLEADDIAGVQAIYGQDPASAQVRGVLENPGHRSFRSGASIISGWVCEAETVEVQIGLSRYPMIYGTDRADTAYALDGTEICGDADNGFITLFNYNILGDGTHTARLLVDGNPYGKPAEFKVTTFGQEFMRGALGSAVAHDFPRLGAETLLIWDQNSQNFQVQEVR